jgi:hypothetical protein
MSPAERQINNVPLYKFSAVAGEEEMAFAFRMMSFFLQRKHFYSVRVCEYTSIVCSAILSQLYAVMS